MSPCPDCGAKVGELHQHGCDVERCPRCGGQMISCSCIYEVCGMDRNCLEQKHPEMYEKYDAEWEHRRMKWTGEWPGVLECREYGLWCQWGPDLIPPRRGWVPCPAGTPGAGEDLNTLEERATWDPVVQRYVLNEKWQ